MPDWRATRPVDVARLNSSVFLAVIGKYEVVLALAAPAYLAAGVLLAHHRFPPLTTTDSGS